MAGNNAMQRTGRTELAMPENPVTAVFKAFPSERYNVLAPITHMPTLPEGTRLSVTEVRVNPDPASKEVFPIAGSDLMLAKVTLDKIAGAAGISWLEEKRIDDRKHPHYAEMFVRGRVTDFDGTVRELTGSKAVDLRQDAGCGIPGKDYDEIASKGRSNGRDFTKQLMEARKFIQEIAASKARNRAIATALGIKRAYSRDELRKPFVVPKLTLDTAHPMAAQVVMATMAGAVNALFGARPAGPVIDAKLESSNTVPADAPPTPAAEEEGAADSPASATPSSEAPDMEAGDPPGMDPSTGEVPAPPSTEEIKRRLGAAWKRIHEARPKFTAQAWQSLVKSATGKPSYDGLTWADLDQVDGSVAAYLANSEG